MIKSLLRDRNFSEDPVGAEIKIGIVEDNNLQELNVGAVDVGSQVEIRLADTDLQEPEDRAKSETIQSAEHSN